MAAVWKRLEKKSKDGVLADIRRYLRVLCRRSELGVQEEFQVVRAGRYERPIKKVLLQIRIVEAGTIPTVVQAGDW